MCVKKKILIWLDADLLHFCIAYYLQKKIDCELYAIIDITNRPKKFYEEQNLAVFKKVWYYHENINKNKKSNVSFLKEFESKYKINLWQLAINERIFSSFNYFHRFSKEEILSILSQECKFFEEVLNFENFDYFLTKETALHYQHLFYEMAQFKKIKTFIMQLSPLGNSCFLSQKYMTVDSSDKHKFVSQNKTFEQLQEFRKKGAFSKQFANYAKELSSSKIGRMKAAIQFLFIANNQNIDTHFTYYGRKKLKVLFNMIGWIFKERIRKKFLDKHAQYKINGESSFLYFPMHVQPERSTLLAAPFYTNQLEVIRHIAKALPIDHILFVKEHPSQELRGWRKISEYKEIMEIPNVKLIHPSVKSDDLIKKASLVISIGGTSSFEAAFFKKPSIIFAELGYQQLSSVIRVKNIEDLHKTICDALKMEITPLSLEKFVDFLNENSFDFNHTQFELKYLNYFYFGGDLVDVDIPISKMKKFLENNKTELESLVSQYIKKIEQN